MNRLLRFDGRVVVVTGAGGGLGKAYALLFADRGASVVVNDLGGTAQGDGSSQRAADSVVDEIKRKGGKAVPNYDSVTEGEKIIETAVQKFGRIDILVNNAGILRDRSFVKMTQEDWDVINQVHVVGSFKTAKAAWEHFRKQNYGRVINTSSVAGLLGNFGQSNYSAAKSGIVGFSNTLAKEGARYNIHTNTIVPMAGSRLTESVFPPELHAALKPELIAPVVAWLCHEDCNENGVVIEAAAGFAAKYQWQRAGGAVLRSSLSDDVTVEAVRDKWSQVTDLTTNADYPTAPEEAMGKLMDALRLQEKGLGSTENISRANLSQLSFPEIKVKYNVNQAILYALGLGVRLTDAEGMNYLYENSDDFRVLPTFPVVPAMQCMYEVLKFPSLNVDFTQILHGEQYVELLRPLEPDAELTLRTEVVEVLDKISGCVYVIKVSGDDEQGPVFVTEWHAFEVGAGKFGGQRDTSKPMTRPIPAPKRSPDAVLSFKTDEGLAALYRLSGDANPLHIDPSFAQMGGFSKPILHGLCTYGIAVRLILNKYANADPKLFRCVKGRFSKPVYPGQTLEVLTWKENTRVPFEVRVKETGQTVISGGYVDLINQTSKL
ncbi:Peroxisomal multifunctional enzyme type 2 [Orchesella cincta]|uniref:Peroxisomal multifunctional enzyme type 2 n=1 Tax=Orchesella cincta TaxID=48709 RepID=A0A1D2MX58_ORCCI|nr:Peroxisomal multifunctional enzyme type 2 [Orchesella cincta]